MHAPLGIPKDAVYEKFTNAFVLERASVSALPFAIDDPSEKRSKGSYINEVIVDLNRGKMASMIRGSLLPKSLPIVVTNYKLQQEERYSMYRCIRSVKL